MTTKQFIGKAIKGGWKNFSLNDIQVIEQEENYRTIFEAVSYSPHEIIHLGTAHEIFLDPLAWQSAGYGRIEALELVNHIWDGGTIEEFLKNL